MRAKASPFYQWSILCLIESSPQYLVCKKDLKVEPGHSNIQRQNKQKNWTVFVCILPPHTCPGTKWSLQKEKIKVRRLCTMCLYSLPRPLIHTTCRVLLFPTSLIPPPIIRSQIDAFYQKSPELIFHARLHSTLHIDNINGPDYF